MFLKGSIFFVITLVPWDFLDENTFLVPWDFPQFMKYTRTLF